MLPQKKTSGHSEEIYSAVTQLHKKMEELAREYESLMPGDARREEIASEISTLSFEFERLKKSR